MNVIQVLAKPRKEAGGGTGKQLRAQKRIPAILYGQKHDPVSLSIDIVSFERSLKHLRGENVMIDLTIEGESVGHRVFLRDMQRDPVTGNLVHVDLLHFDENQKMHFFVPVHAVGMANGVKAGGIQEQHLRTIEIKCLPRELPSHIDADVSNIELHRSLHVSDLTVPDNIAILNPPTDVLFTVLPSKKLEIEAPAAAAAVAEGEGVEEEKKEPELIKKEKGEKAEEAE
jgi:large subunit ribosomal protein L25